MAIRSIEINTYVKPLGGTLEKHNALAPKIKDVLLNTMPSLNINHVDVYNLNGQHHTHEAGSFNERLVIFNNATLKGAPDDVELEAPIVVNGIKSTVTKLLLPKGTGNVLITSPEGAVIAEWFKDIFQLNILFDVFPDSSDKYVEIFKFIISEFERLVWFPKTLENSWKHTQDKDGLTKRFVDKVKQIKENAIREDKNLIARWELEIKEWKQRIKRNSDSLQVKRRSIAVEEENVANVSEAVVRDMDLICALPKVKDLHIKDNKFIIYTNDLIIRSDKGKQYEGGQFRIELVPENADIRFFGGIPHIGYWTDHDPHPHVNGDSGYGCLGNVESTIAELSSQMQIYALVMIAIDYLESANTADSAGKNVTRWKEIKPEGEIPVATVHTAECYHCEDAYLENELVTVYGYIDDDGNARDPRLVCEDCRDDQYYFNEDVEEYIEG